MPTKCLARLTRWEKTNEAIGTSNARASIAYICKNSVKEGVICEGCQERPIEGKYQTRMFHGLVTEPIANPSHIYGSKWYWEKVAKSGDPVKEWLHLAKEAQEEIERCVEEMGLVPWRVQRPGEKVLEEMVKAKKKEASAAVAARAKKPVETVPTAPKAGTLYGVFPKIETLYQESEEPPVVTKMFRCSMEQRPIDGIVRWVSENGRIYEVTAEGKPGVFVGTT